MLLEEKIINYLNINGSGRVSDFRNSFGYPGILVMDSLRKLGSAVVEIDGRWYLKDPPNLVRNTVNKEAVDKVVSEVVNEITDPVAAVAVLDSTPSVPETPNTPVQQVAENPWQIFRRWLHDQKGDAQWTLKSVTKHNWKGTPEIRMRDTIRAIEQLRKWGSLDDVQLMEKLFPELAPRVPEPKKPSSPAKMQIKEIIKKSEPAPHPVEVAVVKQPEPASQMVDNDVVDALPPVEIVAELEKLKCICANGNKPPLDAKQARRWISICRGIHTVLGELGFGDTSHLRLGLIEMDRHFLEQID